ncbi:MAG: putative RNA methyltransferase [Acutalibacteraceae bacterium]
MAGFVCPFCKKSLKKADNRYFCEAGHSFDIAKEGYVHLLPVSKMHSKIPGDTKEMVLSRRRFLQSGYYDLFSDKLNEIVKRYASDGCFIIDAGCGEGFYTKRLSDFLESSESIEIFGFDISKYAVKYASKSDKRTEYAVASVFEMPFSDECADILIDVFAPIAESEFLRTLKHGGYFIYAVPSQNHLFGLKQIAYRSPYKNETRSTDYEGFEFIERIPVRDMIVIDSSSLIDDLFSMTPYYWKTDVDGSRKVRECCHLETEIGFDFLIYRKK